MAKKILVSIFIIYLALLLVGCSSISNTTIYKIENNPDKYINKKVTITGKPGSGLPYPLERCEDTLGELKGFWISDIKTYKERLYPANIFVNYTGDIPSKVIKDKWNRDMSTKIKVTGIVRHKVIKGEGVFYIEGKSWEYVD
jgi:uncharacterized protein YceK